MLQLIARCALAFALAVVAPWAAAGEKIEVLWLGQSATRITSLDGKVILIDPFITQNPKTPAKWKNLDELGRIDLILITHAHGDHLGDGPELAKKLKVPLFGPAGMNQSLLALGVMPSELVPRMNKTGTVMPLGDKIKITMVRAEHSSELVWKNSAGKDEVHVGGEPVGFIIELENGFKVYHMGDTGLFGDMKMIGELYRPDLIMIPIGGHFTMGPKEAAYATSELLKPKHAIPFHYGTFPPLKGTPEQYIGALGSSPVKVHAVQPGDSVSF